MKSFKLKRKLKASLFADDIILHIENPKDLTKNIRMRKTSLIKLHDMKLNIQSQLHFYTLTTNNRNKINKQSHLL